jgi:hypothetical protein
MNFIPPPSAHRRDTLASQLRQLGSLRTFPEFCRFLNSFGVTLESAKPIVRGEPHDFAMAANGTLMTFRELGLADEVACWCRRWDEAAYSVPLSKEEQEFFVVRERWMRLYGLKEDFPRRRWPDLKRVLARLGATVTEAAMLYLYGVPDTRGTAEIVAHITTRCGKSMTQLRPILGPSIS